MDNVIFLWEGRSLPVFCNVMPSREGDTNAIFALYNL